jgi:tRNA G18 (ribose-2'-O)-methylase SpoU
VMDRIAGFPIQRGILAVGRREGARPLRELLAGLPASSLVLAASGISNHDNMGGLMRNSAAFGADAVVIDDLCCDPLYRKAIRVSVGAALKVPFANAGGTGAMITALAEAGFDVWGLSPAGSVAIGRISPSRRMALVVGTEGEGLPPAILSTIRTARISQAPLSVSSGMDSLNLATAAGIALHAVASSMGRI